MELEGVIEEGDFCVNGRGGQKGLLVNWEGRKSTCSKAGRIEMSKRGFG